MRTKCPFFAVKVFNLRGLTVQSCAEYSEFLYNAICYFENPPEDVAELLSKLPAKNCEQLSKAFDDVRSSVRESVLQTLLYDQLPCAHGLLLLDCKIMSTSRNEICKINLVKSRGKIQDCKQEYRNICSQPLF